MRLRRGVPLVAAIVSATAVAAPAAQARFDESMPGQRPVAPHVVSHDKSGSNDSAVIAAGVAAAGIALLGAGAVSSRHVLRRTAHDRVASGT